MVALAYISWVGLLFVPLVLLLCTGWFFVRWKNEHENEKVALLDKARCKKCGIATVIALVVFLVLHFVFPLPAF